MDWKDMDFARRWARRYMREHHPHGLDASDVENIILRRLHYNKDKGERGRKAALSAALNEAQNEGRRSSRSRSCPTSRDIVRGIAQGAEGFPPRLVFE